MEIKILSNKSRINNGGIIKIISIYIITAGLWIFFSDTLLQLFTTNISLLTHIAIAKGLLFVFVTAFMLYFLIRNYYSQKIHAEESLYESEKRYKELADLLPQTIFEIQKDGHIIFVNLISYKMFGYSQDEIAAGFSVFRALIPEDRDRARTNMIKIMNGEERDVREYTALRKDGSTFPIILSTNPILKNGVVTGLRGIAIDITERKNMEDQLRKLSIAVEQNPSSIIITDLKGNIEYVNPRFCLKTGYTLAEIVGKNPSVLKSGEQSDEYYKNLWDTINSGLEWRGEFHNKMKDGSLFWEAASISAIRDKSGQMTHFLAIKEDITDRKLMEAQLIKAKEKAEESDKLKSEFLAQMSHEIRTPLHIILSYNSFLKEELANVLTGDHIIGFTSIDSAGRRLNRTINLILNMAELQAGKLNVKYKDINLYSILKDLTKEFELSAKEKNLELFCINSSNIPPVVQSDEYIVSEVFQNLIDNAVKYTDKGKIEVNIFRSEKDRLCVAIKDTGIGISDEYMNKLFLPFSQEDSGYSRKFDGNGLGLAIVKNYLNLINADINVESVKGKGSTFIIRFN
jgi:PAS domain S-box-containing protein